MLHQRELLLHHHNYLLQSVVQCRPVHCIQRWCKLQMDRIPVQWYREYECAECDELDNIGPLTATDNCGDAEVILVGEVLQSGGCLGVLVRTYTATDECGNSTTVNQYIVIEDHTPPVLPARISDPPSTWAVRAGMIKTFA